MFVAPDFVILTLLHLFPFDLTSTVKKSGLITSSAVVCTHILIKFCNVLVIVLIF